MKDKTNEFDKECVMPDYEAMYYNLQDEHNAKMVKINKEYDKKLEKLNEELQFYKDIIKRILHI